MHFIPKLDPVPLTTTDGNPITINGEPATKSQSAFLLECLDHDVFGKGLEGGKSKLRLMGDIAKQTDNDKWYYAIESSDFERLKVGALKSQWNPRLVHCLVQFMEGVRDASETCPPRPATEEPEPVSEAAE